MSKVNSPRAGGRAPLITKLTRRSRVSDSGCLEWTGHLNSAGRGLLALYDAESQAFCVENRVTTGTHGRQMNVLVYRLMWALKNGTIPEGQVVRHKCDNPLCLNVDHLELGTQSENMADMHQRGRAIGNRGTQRFYSRGTTLEQKFMGRLKPVGECLIYQGSISGSGYGVFFASDDMLVAARALGLARRGAGDVGALPAHRLAYALAHGPVAAGLVIRHTCDNPACCNPAHLVSGTQKQNMADMAERGRRKGNARITEEDVVRIRERAATGESIGAIATDYGLSSSNVTMMSRGDTWKHVGGPRSARLRGSHKSIVTHVDGVDVRTVPDPE